MAEREGFEPSVPVSQYDGLANRWIKPLSHLSVWPVGGWLSADEVLRAVRMQLTRGLLRGLGSILQRTGRQRPGGFPPN
jgi:hypothetical protein